VYCFFVWWERKSEAGNGRGRAGREGGKGEVIGKGGEKRIAMLVGSSGWVVGHRCWRNRWVGRR
jgi:hypothetical protein